MNFFIILVRGISLNQVKRGDFPLPLRGGHWDFRFCGFGYFLDRFFGFGVQCGLRIFRFLASGFRFS